MTGVKNVLKDLDQLDMPVEWTDVERRSPSRLPEPPRAHRVVTVIVAFTVFAGAVGLLWAAVGSGDRQHIGGDGAPPLSSALIGGQVLVTVSSEDGADFDIYRMNPDGSDLTPVLADPAYRDSSATLSPDGTQIAFVRSAAPIPNAQGGYDFSSGSDIYVMDADGTHLAQLTNQPDGGATHDEPAWSPDGTRIAYRSSEAGSLDVWVMGADGSNAHRLTDIGGYNAEPIWSPDGAKIAFDSDRERPADSWGSNIWVMNADGSDPTRLTDTTDGDVINSWSPDGTRIAFQRSVNHSDYAWDVWVMNSDGTGQQQLTDWVGRDGGALWSPEGTEIMFSSDRYIDEQRAQHAAEPGGSGSWPDAVYSMHADGTHVTEILPQTARVWPSDWTGPG